MITTNMVTADVIPRLFLDYALLPIAAKKLDIP